MTTPQKVLVVEDEASIASFVSLYLKNAGYDVQVAETGEDALVKAEGQQPSLIVLDLMLPDIDGIEVCRRLHERLASAVIVLVTSGDCADVARLVRSCGAVALLAKQNLNPAVLRGIWMIHGPVPSPHG